MSVLFGRCWSVYQRTWILLIDPALDLWQPLVLFSNVVTFRQIDQVDDRFCREQLETIDVINLSVHACRPGQFELSMVRCEIRRLAAKAAISEWNSSHATSIEDVDELG